MFRTVRLLSPIINYPSQGITFACENNRGILSARTRSIRGDACRTFEKYPPDDYIGDTLYRVTGLDKIVAEHIVYSHPCLIIHIKLLFSMMVNRYYVPDAFG